MICLEIFITMQANEWSCIMMPCTWARRNRERAISSWPLSSIVYWTSYLVGLKNLVKFNVRKLQVCAFTANSRYFFSFFLLRGQYCCFIACIIVLVTEICCDLLKGEKVYPISFIRDCLLISVVVLLVVLYRVMGQWNRAHDGKRHAYSKRLQRHSEIEMAKI